MSLRNRERRSRSYMRLAIVAILSLVFCISFFAIIHTTKASVDKNTICSDGYNRSDAEQAYCDNLVLLITDDADTELPDCTNGRSGYEKATIYEKSCFYKKYNDLGAIGSFHLIGLTEIQNVWGRIYGNIATKSLVNVQKLGVNNLAEINYIANNVSNIGYQFFSNGEQSIVVFGDGVIVRKFDDVNIRIGNPSSWTNVAIGSYNETFWQDYTAKFLDMDQLRSEAIAYNQDTRNKYLNFDPNDEDDPEHDKVATGSTCTLTGGVINCNIFDNTKVSYVNIGSSDINSWGSGGQINSTIRINNAAPEGTFLINIDARGLSTLTFPNIEVNLSDGLSINSSNFNNYTETAETNIVFNIYDSSQPDGLYRGSIHGNGTFYGMLVAPAAIVEQFSTGIRGTVIADIIRSVSNTYQSNFVGHLVYFPKIITVHHVNGEDGTPFAEDQTIEVFAGDPYSISPVDFDENLYDVEYDGEFEGVNYAETGTMPDADFEVTYTYSPKGEKYDFIVHHYLEGTTTSYKPDHVEHLNPGDSYEAVPDTSDPNYEYYLKTGDSATGTMGTTPVTVTYYYKKKTATLTVIHIVDGNTVYNSTSDIEWGEEVPRDSFLPTYADSHNHTVTVNPDVTTVSGDVTVTYTYTRKMFSYVVHHYLEGTETSLYPDETGTYGYGTSYSTSPIEDNPNYEGYIRDGDDAYGTIGGPVEIVYFYHKKTATLTIIDVIDGVSNTRSTTTVEWGDPVARDEFLSAYADSHNHSVNVSPDVATVGGDVTVTYTYTIKTFSFTVHHYYEGTTTSYKPDHNETINYGGSYIATPDTSDNNYEYHLKEGDSATGTVFSDTTVTYYYKKKTATFKIIDIVDGVESERSSATKEWGDSYEATPLANLSDSHSYTVSGGSETGTIAGDVTITYTYTINNYPLTVHHYYDGTTTSYKPDHTENLNHGATYTATPDTSDDTYEYHLKDGDSASGTMSGPTTVTYYYAKKTATVTVIDVVDGVSSTRSSETAEWGSTIIRDDFLPQYNDSHNHSVSVSPDVETVAGDVTITYTYNKKDVTLTVHHLLGDGSNYVDDTTTNYKYGDEYEALPDTHDNNYEYAIKVGDSATGVITSDIEITYYYRKKRATLTIIDVVDGVSNTRSTTTVEWGDDVARDAYLAQYDESHNHSVSVNPDVTKVAGDVTVTYTYTIKTFNFTVHHYYDGTTTSYKPDHTETLNYGVTYTATPDTSDNTYEYHLKDGDSATGVVTDDTTVTFYYKKKTAKLTIIHIVDGEEVSRNETDVEWGDPVARDEFLPAYADSHNHSVNVSPDVATVAGDVTVTYTYTIKTFNFTVHHFYDGTTDSYKPDQSSALNYGAEYTATPDTSNNNYEYHLKDGDSATGYIYNDTTVTFYYKKKTATITVKHQDMQGNELAPTESISKEWGDPYETHPSSSLAEAYQYTVTGGSETGTVSGDLTIIYRYTKKAYILTVHHLLENGDIYKDDTTTDYEHGDTYTALPDTSDNNYEYRLKEGDSATGQITSNLEVTFIYKKKTAKLTIIHIVDGEEVSRSETDVEWGDDVARNNFLPEYSVSHNHGVSVSPDVTKVAGDVAVTYTYTIKQYTLTVHHRLENGDTYKPDVATVYSHGATYVAAPDTSNNNYEYYLANGDSASGPITSDMEVTYIYKKKTATFKVIHQNAQGETLAPTETTTLEWGDPYEAHPSSSLTTEYNYTADKAETGTISGDVTITYTYTRKTFTVTVHHIYADGTPFADDDTVTVEYGQSYTATPKNNPNYNVIVTEGSLENDSITSDTVITIKYVIKQGNITVKHLDENGSALAPEEHYSVDYGESYSANPNASLLEAYDYTVDVAESDVVSGDVIITYTYTKKKYTLTVHHVLENGSEYRPDKTYNYEHGDQYNAPADTSDNNYEYHLKEGDSASGQITSNLEVTYVYKKKLATFRVRHLDKNGNSLVEDEVTQIEWGETYHAHPASSLSAGYTHTVDGEESDIVAGDVTITYTYTKKKLTLTIHHVDVDGNQIADDEEIEIEWGDHYVPSGAASLINDYDFEVDPNAPIPEVITENGEFTLIYTKKPEVPKTYDDVIYTVVSALITLIGAGAVVLSAKKRRV